MYITPLVYLSYRRLLNPNDLNEATTLHNSRSGVGFAVQRGLQSNIHKYTRVPNGMKFIDNFIKDPNTMNLLKNKFFDKDFPWYYSDNVAFKNEKNKSFYFVHNFYRDGKQLSDWFDLIHPILGQLNFQHILHVRANCYTYVKDPVTHDYHVDRDSPHKVALFSVNSNNGYTQFKGSGEKVYSVENRMLLFNGLEDHRSTTQTDENLRINVNINYV